MAFPNAPSPLSYGPPQVSFEGLDQLGNNYFQGAEQRRKYDLARAFQGGIPKKADGTPDFGAMADILAQHGAPEQVIPFSQQAVEQEQRSALQGALGPGAVGGAPSPSAPPQAAPSTPSVPVGVPPRTATPSAPAPRGAMPQPALSSAGTDNEGAQTLRGMITELAGGRDVSPLIPRFAAGLKVRADDPLTPEQEAQFKPILGRSLETLSNPQPQAQASAPGGQTGLLLPPGADPRQEIAKLRATADKLVAVAGPSGARAAQQYYDRADKLESDAFGDTRRAQGNLDRAFTEQVRQHDLLANKPVPVTAGTQLVHPLTGIPIVKNDTGLLDAPTIDAMARQAMSGDTSVFTNLGRGAQGAENVIAVRKRIAELNSGSGESGAEQAQRNAEFFGVKSGQRTLGTRSANIELAATEFKQVLPVVQAASKSVNRTNYPDLNKIIQMFEEKTGDPNVVKFGGGVNTLVNLYARAISPSGNPTVSDKDHARLILNRAWSQGQFDAAVSMMSQEIDAALSSPEKVRDAMRERFLKGQGGAKAPAGEPNSAVPTQSTPAGKPQSVIQNGHTYTLQPDGSYK